MATTTVSGQASALRSSATSMSSLVLDSSTKPPSRDRAAEPEACPARLASRAVSRFASIAAAAATVNAANEDADEASPAAIGKLQVLVIRACGRSLPATRSRHADRRGSLPASGAPLTRSSSADNAASNSTCMRVKRSRSVIEIEPTAGKLRTTSRLPQYLISAMLGCAMAVACMPAVPLSEKKRII